LTSAGPVAGGVDQLPAVKRLAALVAAVEQFAGLAVAAPAPLKLNRLDMIEKAPTRSRKIVALRRVDTT
jgi:hypothetical protein